MKSGICPTFVGGFNRVVLPGALSKAIGLSLTILGSSALPIVVLVPRPVLFFVNCSPGFTSNDRLVVLSPLGTKPLLSSSLALLLL